VLGHLLACDPGQLLIEPTAALRERLRVRDHAPHVFEAAALREQRRIDTRSTRSAQTVTSRSPNASSVWVTTPSVGVLDGDDPSCARPASTAANTSEMAADPAQDRERAELLARRLVRERALGPR
jgi:hypothetical protein